MFARIVRHRSDVEIALDLQAWRAEPRALQRRLLRHAIQLLLGDLVDVSAASIDVRSTSCDPVSAARRITCRRQSSCASTTGTRSYGATDVPDDVPATLPSGSRSPRRIMLARNEFCPRRGGQGLGPNQPNAFQRPRRDATRPALPLGGSLSLMDTKWSSRNSFVYLINSWSRSSRCSSRSSSRVGIADNTPISLDRARAADSGTGQIKSLEVTDERVLAVRATTSSASAPASAATQVLDVMRNARRHARPAGGGHLRGQGDRPQFTNWLGSW